MASGDGTQAHPSAHIADEEEIYLSDIIAALGRRKRLIAACVTLVTLVGLLYAVLSTPLYTASVTVQPSTEDAGGLSGLRSQFGGVAALAGVDLGGGGSTKDEYLAILRSRQLTDRFFERNMVLPHLFPDAWDAEAGAWKQSEPGLISRAARGISRTLARLSGDEGWREERGPGPSLWEAYKAFNEKVRNIREDAQTGIVTVEFEFRDPALAARWANDYVAMANAEIREKAVVESTRALAYLDEEVQKTTIAGVRETIFSLVEAQLEKIMLANSRPEYAFKVLDRAVVPEERSHPKRALIVVLSLMLGSMVGVFAALAREAWRGAFAAGKKKGSALGEG